MRTKSTSVFSLMGCVTVACVPLLPTTPVLAQQTTTPIALTLITQAQRDQMSRSIIAIQTHTILLASGVLNERARLELDTARIELAGAQRELAAVRLQLAAVLTVSNSQSCAIIPENRARMQKSLVAVKTVILVRDEAIGAAERRARIAALEGDLTTARANYNTRIAAAAASNASVNREVQALRADTQAVVSILSDEEVRQRQRFVNGDAGALEIMERLAAARSVNVDRVAKQQLAQIRREIARNFATAVARGDSGRTSAMALAQWEQAVALDPTNFWQHIERARLNVTLGRSEAAKAAAQQARQYATTTSDRLFAQNELGKIVAAQGDRVGALALYEETLTAWRALELANPTDRQVKSDLAFTLINIADIKLNQGDVLGARRQHQEGLTIMRLQLSAEPRSAQAMRDVLIGLNKVGQSRASQGDGQGALAAYQESLAIARAQRQLDPSSITFKRDVTDAFDNVADIKSSQGDGAGALAVYQQSLVIRRELAQADPSSAIAKSDMSLSLSKVAGIKAEQGDGPGALVLYQEALEIRRALAQADPRSAKARRDLGVSLAKVAELAPVQVRWREVYEHWLAMQREGKLAASDESALARFKNAADGQDRTSPVRAAPSR